MYERYHELEPEIRLISNAESYAPYKARDFPAVAEQVRCAEADREAVSG